MVRFSGKQAHRERCVCIGSTLGMNTYGGMKTAGGKKELKCQADVTEVSQSHGRPWSWNGPFKLFCIKVGGPGLFPASITGCGFSVGRGHDFE